jgi:hypothetical protein
MTLEERQPEVCAPCSYSDPEAEGVVAAFHTEGRYYDDELITRAERWRIRQRRCRVTWSDGMAGGADFSNA